MRTTEVGRSLGSLSINLPLPSSEMEVMPALPIFQNYFEDQMWKQCESESFSVFPQLQNGDNAGFG